MVNSFPPPTELLVLYTIQETKVNVRWSGKTSQLSLWLSSGNKKKGRKEKGIKKCDKIVYTILLGKTSKHIRKLEIFNYFF